MIMTSTATTKKAPPGPPRRPQGDPRKDNQETRSDSHKPTMRPPADKQESTGRVPGDPRRPRPPGDQQNKIFYSRIREHCANALPGNACLRAPCVPTSSPCRLNVRTPHCVQRCLGTEMDASGNSSAGVPGRFTDDPAAPMAQPGHFSDTCDRPTVSFCRNDPR